MNYNQAIRFLSSLIDYERWVHRNYSFKLDNYIRFLDGIGNPQKRLKRVVLVAGTKGKGSTALMLSRILAAHGERVGTYTSPHLLTYTERIKVQGKEIPKRKFARLLDELRPAIQKHEPRITFFEALTTIAIGYFLKQGTTVNVFEIGVGGRLDATNALDPELSVITRIGFDHTKMLGTSLAKIAREKCGIMRKNKPVVIAGQRPKVRKVIAQKVKEKGVKSLWFERDFQARLTEDKRDGLRFTYQGLNLDVLFKIPVMGAHQIENAAAAIASAQVLISEIRTEKIQKALEQIRLPARIEVIEKNPTVILDMSHNPEAAATLRKTLDKHFSKHKNRVLLLGVTKHKDKRKMVETLAPFFTSIYVTQANLPRAEPGEKLLQLCSGIHTHCILSPTVKDGVNTILDDLAPSDLFVITGSVYVAGEALEVLKRRERAQIG